MTAQNMPADTVSLHEVEVPHDLPEGLSLEDVVEFFHSRDSSPNGPPRTTLTYPQSQATASKAPFICRCILPRTADANKPQIQCLCALRTPPSPSPSLDQSFPSGRVTSPARTGFRWT